MIRAARILSIFTAILSGFAAENIGPIELVPLATSGTHGILLSDVAKNGQSLPKIVLGPAPAIGRPVLLNKFQINDLLAKKAPEFACSNWTGVDRVRVIRATRQVDESALRELLSSTLQREHVKDRGELELRFARPWATLTVPDDVLSIRILELPSLGVSPNFICRFELLAGGEPVGTYSQPLQARIMRDIYVAHSGLTRGQLLRDADIAVESRDILALRDYLTQVPNDEGYLEFRENVSAGSPLTARALRLRAIIKRGRLVEALWQDDSLTIAVKAEALEDGIPGQMMRLRNLRSKREFKGKVQDEQTVLVMF